MNNDLKKAEKQGGIKFPPPPRVGGVIKDPRRGEGKEKWKEKGKEKEKEKKESKRGRVTTK